MTNHPDPEENTPTSPKQTFTADAQIELDKPVFWPQGYRIVGL